MVENGAREKRHVPIRRRPTGCRPDLPGCLATPGVPCAA